MATRILKTQVSQLASLMAEGFMKVERAQVNKQLGAAYRIIADKLFTDDVKESFAHVIGTPAEQFLRAQTDSDTVRIADLEGRLVDGLGYIGIDYTMAYGSSQEFTRGTPTRTTVMLGKREIAKVQAALDARTDLNSRTNKLRGELEANITTARTMEKLVEVWPEARDAIVAFFEHVSAKETVEQPLEQLVRRYSSLPALTYVAEGEAS